MGLRTSFHLSLQEGLGCERGGGEMLRSQDGGKGWEQPAAMRSSVCAVPQTR